MADVVIARYLIESRYVSETGRSVNGRSENVKNTPDLLKELPVNELSAQRKENTQTLIFVLSNQSMFSQIDV
jgi:hypothetical protein